MKMVKINKKAIKKFLKENGFFMAKLAFMGFVALHADPALASTTGEKFSTITGPLNTVKDTISGPVAKAVGTIGIAGAALATGLNMENQVMKRAIQLTGGTAGAVGAGSLMADIGGDSTGLLFF